MNTPKNRATEHFLTAVAIIMACVVAVALVVGWTQILTQIELVHIHPNSDDDGDGSTNLEEYQHNTDPKDPSSYPKSYSLFQGNGAAFVNQEVPMYMEAGKTYPMSVTMHNVGTANWLSGNQEGAYRLGSQYPQDNDTWGTRRVELNKTTKPWSEHTFVFNVTAPSILGMHYFQWRMVQGNEKWFGDYTPALPVEVVAHDANNNGIPDVWEMQIFGDLTHVDPNEDGDEDGLTNLQEYQNGTDPRDHFNGHMPFVSVISGDNQQGYIASDGKFVPAPLAPLVLKVIDNATNLPVNGVKVNLVPEGWELSGVKIASSPLEKGTSDILTLTSDSQGLILAYVQMPAKLPKQNSKIEAAINYGLPFFCTVRVPIVSGVVQDPDGDNDHDGLTNEQEQDEGTDPNKMDTDGDGIPDSEDAVPLDPDIKFSRCSGPPAYFVIDLKGFTPVGMNNSGQMAGCNADGVTGVWSGGEFYPYANFPSHNNWGNPVLDEVIEAVGIDDEGNFFFNDKAVTMDYFDFYDHAVAYKSHFDDKNFEEATPLRDDSELADNKLFQNNAIGMAVGLSREDSTGIRKWISHDKSPTFEFIIPAIATSAKVQGTDDLIETILGLNDAGQIIGVTLKSSRSDKPSVSNEPVQGSSGFERHSVIWPGGEDKPISLGSGDEFPELTGINNLSIITGNTVDLGATLWLGELNWKKKALPLPKGISSKGIRAIMMNNLGQMLVWSDSQGACLWQNAHLYPLDKLVGTDADYKDIHPDFINDEGVIVGTATFVATSEIKHVMLGTIGIVKATP